MPEDTRLELKLLLNAVTVAPEKLITVLPETASEMPICPPIVIGL